TAPTGALANSGWQYQAYTQDSLGTANYLCTPIGPNVFITARHLGTDISVVTFQGTNYQVVSGSVVQYPDYGTNNVPDLEIGRIVGTFPIIADLSTRYIFRRTPSLDSSGHYVNLSTGPSQLIVAFGRGVSGRGPEVYNDPANQICNFDRTLRGWQ